MKKINELKHAKKSDLETLIELRKIIADDRKKRWADPEYIKLMQEVEELKKQGLP